MPKSSDAEIKGCRNQKIPNSEDAEIKDPETGRYRTEKMPSLEDAEFRLCYLATLGGFGIRPLPIPRKEKVTLL